MIKTNQPHQTRGREDFINLVVVTISKTYIKHNTNGEILAVFIINLDLA